MRKKIFVVLFVATFMLIGCGTADKKENQGTEALSEKSVQDDTSSDLDALGDVKVDESFFDVNLTIPAQYVGDKTQEQLDATAEEAGYKSITLNEDGSATYIMTKKQHKEMLSQMADSLNTSLEEMIGSEDYPNITDIKANNNFTEFTVTTKSTELDMGESFSVMTFYMAGGVYNIFSGDTVDNIHVDFVNADTGNLITSADSKDMSDSSE